MTRPVIWSRPAANDIKKQITFIARDNPIAARQIVNGIREAGNALGKAMTGRPGRVTGTYEKSLVRLPYIIAYMLEPNTNRESVLILRVIHKARNWPANQWPD